MPCRVVHDDHFFDLRRLQGVPDEHGRIGIILQNVDFLAFQLPDDRLDARAAHADAGADRIHVIAGGVHGHLGSVAGLPDHLVDLDRAIVDLRHLELEDLADELRVRARQDDLQAGGGLLHFVDESSDAVVRPIHFPRALVLARHDAFRLAQVHEDGAVPLALVVADDHLTDLVLILRVQRILLDLAQGLSSALLGALDGDAIEVARIDLDQQFVADLRLIVVTQRVLQPDLRDRVVNHGDDALLRIDGDIGGVIVEADDGVLGRAESALVGCEQHVLDRLDDQVLGDAAVLHQLADRQRHLTGHRFRPRPQVRRAQVRRDCFGQSCLRSTVPS